MPFPPFPGKRRGLRPLRETGSLHITVIGCLVGGKHVLQTHAFHLGREGVSEQKVSGSRVFQFTKGKPSFRTWVRLLGGEIQNEVELF